MRFLVDDQLPPALARAISAAGYNAVHVLDLDLSGTGDPIIWARACADDRIMITKDADFARLQTDRQPPVGRILWVRLGNCRKPVLLSAIVPRLARLVARFDRGEWLIEVP